jgi:hypothetical protein
VNTAPTRPQTDPELILRQLMVDGHEGASLLAAFGRWVRALNGADVVSPPVVMVARRRKARPPERDRRQTEMMLASDGGRAKAPPMTAAERQAKRRAEQRSVTLRDTKVDQVLEIIEESRNVTNKRDSLAQAVDSVDETGNGTRDSVTRNRKKEVPPHPLKKKLHPQIPPGGEIVTLGFDDPLIPVLEELAGKTFPRFGKGRSFKRKHVDAAMALVAQRSTSPPLKATG